MVVESADGRMRVVEWTLRELDLAVFAEGRAFRTPLTATAEALMKDVADGTTAPSTFDFVDAMLRTDCLARDVCGRLRITPWRDGSHGPGAAEQLMLRTFDVANRHPTRACITTLHLLAAALLSADRGWPELAVLDTDPDEALSLLARWKPARNPEFRELFQQPPLTGHALSDAIARREDLEGELGRYPTAEELADRAGLTVGEATYAVPWRRHTAQSVPFEVMESTPVEAFTWPVTATPGSNDLDEQIRKIADLMRDAGYRVVNVVMIDDFTASVAFSRRTDDAT